MKKRVLIFSLAYYPHVGGAEIALKEITDRISDTEFEMITLNFGGDPAEEQIGNILVHRIGKDASYISKILFAPRAARLAAHLTAERPCTALWAMMSYMLFPIVLLRRRGIRVPYLLTLQEGDPFAHVFNRLRILPFRPMLREGFRNASAVQAISTYLAKWASGAGYRGEPVVVPNGVDTAHFASVEPVPHEGVRLVTTSRLVAKNAVDDVICALALLPENVRFIVYGTGEKEAALRRLARTIGVADRVEWRGHIGHGAMPAALAECDIFVRPSRSEGMGNSFIEAMAAGLPVIATQEGGIADFLFDAKRNPEKPATGWAVDKDSPHDIAEAVKDILAHPKEAKRVVARAKKMAQSHYDWSLVAGKIEKIIHTLSRSRRKPKIAIATPLYPPEIGGPATYAKLLEGGLPSRGIEAEVVTFSHVRHLPKAVRHYVYYRRVLAAARAADAVLALDPVSVGWPAKRAARRAGIPLLVKIVGDYAWEQGQQRFGITATLDEFIRTADVPLPVRILRHIETSVARAAATVIVPSEYLKGVVSAWGIDRAKIVVIPNAVPQEEVGAVPKEFSSLPRPLVVTAGRLVPWKHIEGIIDAVELLHRDSTSASLAVIGDGPDREKLEAHAAVLGSACRFTGRLSHADTLAAIREADVFVLNSSYEGFSHLLVEALSLGTPVIATRVGGNAEIVTDGQNGILVPLGDTKGLAQAMDRILLDVPFAREIRAHAQESVAEFSPDAMLAKTAALLTSL